MVSSLPVTVRHVWAHNLMEEFGLIHQSLLQYHIVSMDTEFPGTVYQPSGVPVHLRSNLSPTNFYAVMKKNIDELKLIQLGLTLSDKYGNLPHFNTGSQYIWEFNFRDFDLECDLHNHESIALLKRQGIDFSKNKEFGIDSREFGKFFRMTHYFRTSVTWITFHGAYDLGFLIKIVMIGRDYLPHTLDGFMIAARFFLGDRIYDLKNMIRFLGLHGGLDRVAGSLNLKRVAGKSHQAGSDSLMTMHAFLEFRKYCSDSEMTHVLNMFNYNLYGLTSAVN